MSKARAHPPQAPASVNLAPQAPPTMLSTQSAIYLLHAKIQALDESHRDHMKAVETKFGEQDTYVTDNIPDMDQLYKAISTINARLLDLEGLEARIAALEAGSGSSPAPKPAASKKRGGTVKLDLDTEPGVSFS